MKQNILLSLTILLAFTSCKEQEADYDASGIFEATEVIVSAKQAGELTAFRVEEGQTVSEGEVLGNIDVEQLQLQKKQIGANISATRSRRLDAERQVASMRQQIANLQHERARFAQLVADGAGNQKQVDDIDQQIQVIQRQIAAATEQIGSSNESLEGQTSGMGAQIEQVENQIGKGTITSPITGTVLAKYMERGEYAVPGKALFKVADLTDMTLRAYLTADQLTQVKLGQKVTVLVDYGKTDRKQFQGSITWLSDKAEFTPKTIQTRDERANLVYAIKVKVKNPDGLIKKGMYGDLRLLKN